MTRGLAIVRLATAGLLAVACAAAKPNRVESIRPNAAVKHARGDQVDIANRGGAPDAVSFYATSGVSQWVYCDSDGGWARMIDFDGDGNILITLEMPDVQACASQTLGAP